MWYTGWNSDDAAATGRARLVHQRIGFASSADGVRWTKEPGDAGGGRCSASVPTAASTLMRPASRSWSARAARSQWYEASTGKWRIATARSADGRAWTRGGAGTGRAGRARRAGRAQPVVVKRRGQWELWYQGAAAPRPPTVLRANSDDGRRWTKRPGEVALARPAAARGRAVHVDGVLLRPDGSCQVFFARQKTLSRRVAGAGAHAQLPHLLRRGRSVRRALALTLLAAAGCRPLARPAGRRADWTLPQRHRLLLHVERDGRSRGRAAAAVDIDLARAVGRRRGPLDPASVEVVGYDTSGRPTSSTATPSASIAIRCPGTQVALSALAHDLSFLLPDPSVTRYAVCFDAPGSPRSDAPLLRPGRDGDLLPRATAGARWRPRVRRHGRPRRRRRPRPREGHASVLRVLECAGGARYLDRGWLTSGGELVLPATTATTPGSRSRSTTGTATATRPVRVVHGRPS
jgi:hypothetical protein